ncbi:hypothetical protein NL676_020407 [Syzygium grande]|nr:hypothetical protein NL676_020407 [Syzygium grande]
MWVGGLSRLNDDDAAAEPPEDPPWREARPCAIASCLGNCVVTPSQPPTGTLQLVPPPFRFFHSGRSDSGGHRPAQF